MRARMKARQVGFVFEQCSLHVVLVHKRLPYADWISPSARSARARHRTQPNEGALGVRDAVESAICNGGSFAV